MTTVTGLKEGDTLLPPPTRESEMIGDYKRRKRREGEGGEGGECIADMQAQHILSVCGQ